MLQDVVVVGASLAGLRAVETFRTEGYDGRLTLIGDEPHLPYDRPPLSKKVLAGEWEPDRIHLRKDARVRRSRARAAPRGTGRRRSTSSVSVVGAGRRRRRALRRRRPGHGRRTPTAARTARPRRRLRPADARRLPGAAGRARRRTAPGGGGRGRVHRRRGGGDGPGRGLEVTLVEALPLPLVRGLGPVLGAAIADLHRAHGVDVRLGVGVDAIEGDRPGRAGAPERRQRRRRRRGRRRHRRRAGHGLARGQRARAARRRRVRCHPGRRAAGRLRRGRPGALAERACSTRRCASSTGRTRPSRAPPRPATCWRRPPAEPVSPTRRCRSSGATSTTPASSSSAGPAATTTVEVVHGSVAERPLRRPLRPGRAAPGRVRAEPAEAGHAVPEAPRQRRDLGGRPRLRRAAGKAERDYAQLWARKVVIAPTVGTLPAWQRPTPP